MLTFAQARERLLAAASPGPTERVALAEGGGRTLARDLVAARSQPPEAASAMDGYAVRGEDARLGARLEVIGAAPAGAPFEGEVSPGSAVRIATGGVVPAGADLVVMQELVAIEGGAIRIVEAPGAAGFVRAAGSDFVAGEAIVRAGAILTPARLGLAAAANAAELIVYRRPVVAILPSGDELREPGATLGKGEIADSAGYAAAELVCAWGGIAIRGPILPDDRESCRARLAEADLEAGIIVPLGGASVGERDSLRPLFEEMGATIVFERVAVQPGKPTWHALFPDRRIVLGLPGNPASAFVCAWLFLKPLVERLSGRPAEAPHFVAARSAGALAANGPRESYLRGNAWIGADAVVEARAERHQDSHLQSPLARANALIRRPPHAPTLAAGEPVDLLLIGEIG